MNPKYLDEKVDANNEFSSFFYTEGSENADLKVMFVGNSITIHEVRPRIGWNSFCGMAASDMEHDYVHIVYRHLLEKYKSVSICVCNGGRWEKSYTDPNHLKPIVDLMNKYQPDIIIIRIGENYNRDYIKEGHNPYFAFNDLFKAAKAVTNNVVTTSLFWEWELIDNTIQKVALENNAKFVYIGDLEKDPSNKALGQFENIDVSHHPNNKGMKEIADRIIRLLD